MLIRSSSSRGLLFRGGPLPKRWMRLMSRACFADHYGFLSCRKLPLPRFSLFFFPSRSVQARLLRLM
ncbi:hypothetical protein Arad_2612 [Rhizobium rhizogenes K84]|uniref:Uncharacterized protein n=1 Tax=Rhizobium rhizogenes (strain K84 / ATCC BAA-868) TaxID=311403 RepID=B9JFS2_RHIR8|nr:hypothetical protein Arad_2612 [Rhizobium rhizogenes K84]